MEKSHANDVEVVSGSVSDEEVQGFDAAGTKRLLRKLDWHLIPFMSLIYLSVAFPMLFIV
jgi:hypothetical protein